MGDFCEHGNEQSEYSKYVYFLAIWTVKLIASQEGLCSMKFVCVYDNRLLVGAIIVVSKVSAYGLNDCIHLL
jgi:hypothetical protein